MRALIILALVACDLGSVASDYKEPAVGSQAYAAYEQCKKDRTQPCGWVYAFPAVEKDNPLGVLELCIVWPDRIGPYPVRLLESAESLYGDAVLSWHERFAGTPLCAYRCLSASGCNAYDGCFCLDGSP